MSQTRDNYMINGQSVPEILSQLNFFFARIGDRLDKIEGIRGDSTIASNLNMSGQKITNIAPGISESDAAALTQIQVASSSAVLTVINPAALSAGTTDNYAPAGLSTARVIQITTALAGSSLSGIAMQTGALLTLINDGPGDLTLLNQNSGSVAANRFQLAGDLVLPAYTSTTLLGAASCWLGAS